MIVKFNEYKYGSMPMTSNMGEHQIEAIKKVISNLQKKIQQQQCT